MQKTKAFVMCFCAIVFIFISMYIAALLSANYDLIPVGKCLTALVTITGSYIGLKICDSGVKGKYWNQAMHDSLNKK